MTLRKYQERMLQSLEERTAQGLNVLAVAPTGSGKTVVMTEYVRRHPVPTVLIVHRRELLLQLSLKLAKEGITHRVVAPKQVVKQCADKHIESLGRSYIRPDAEIGVASVDAFIRRKLGSWSSKIERWIVDEAHHLIADNKWGRAVQRMPHAVGVGFTATPERSDGQGLGAQADGVFDVIVEGPSTQELIDQGYLCPLYIHHPASPLQTDKLKASRATGDYTPQSVSAAFDLGGRQVLADVVGAYLRWAPGEAGITFCPSVAGARRLADEYVAHGIPAVALDGSSSPDLRRRALEALSVGEIRMIVNAALFDEGLDIPGISVVCDAYPTKSASRYLQRIGRAMRTAAGKSRAKYLDLADNTRNFIKTHKCHPTESRRYTLARRPQAAKASDVAVETRVKTCKACHLAYPAHHGNICPMCGAEVPIKLSSNLKEVEGDLTLLTEEAIAELKGERIDIHVTDEDYETLLKVRGCPEIGIRRNVRRRRRNIDAQVHLRDAMRDWKIAMEHLGYTGKSELQRLFYECFGIDVLSAQALKERDAKDLENGIRAVLVATLGPDGKPSRSSQEEVA